VRVLIIEDHPDTADVLGRVLARSGHIVQSVGTATEAFHLCVGSSFDLLIVDIGLPDGDGWTLLPRIRQRSPIKALALTGFGTADDLERSRAAGFDAHLTKPVDFATLNRTIAELIGPGASSQPTS
jgi:CheY-like chemotaxis protein